MRISATPPRRPKRSGPSTSGPRAVMAGAIPCSPRSHSARSEEHTSELQSPYDLVALRRFPTRRSSDLFAIGAVVTLPLNQPAGDLVVPAKLRYQACDANLCYPPATAEAQWTIHVGPASGDGGRDPVFATIAFG